MATEIRNFGCAVFDPALHWCRGPKLYCDLPYEIVGGYQLWPDQATALAAIAAKGQPEEAKFWEVIDISLPEEVVVRHTWGGVRYGSSQEVVHLDDLLEKLIEFGQRILPSGYPAGTPYKTLAAIAVEVWGDREHPVLEDYRGWTRLAGHGGGNHWVGYDELWLISA